MAWGGQGGFLCEEDKGTLTKDRVSIPQPGQGRDPCVSVCEHAFVHVHAHEYADEHVCVGAHICTCVKTREQSQVLSPTFLLLTLGFEYFPTGLEIAM